MPVASWSWGRLPLPVGGGSYWRILPTAVLLKALSSMVRTGTRPILYFHPSEFDLEPLRSSLAVPKMSLVGARGAYVAARDEIGRRRISPRLRAIAQRFRLGPLQAALLSEPDRSTMRVGKGGAIETIGRRQ